MVAEPSVPAQVPPAATHVDASVLRETVKVTSDAFPEGDATEVHETKALVPLGIALTGPGLASDVADASPEPPSEWLFTDIYKD